MDQLSNDIAKLPKSVYKKEGDSRMRFTDPPLNYLITIEPNKMMTAFDFGSWLLFWLSLKGIALF